MKRTDPISVGEALQDFFERRRLSQGTIEGRAVALWGEIVGPYAAAATEDVYIRSGVIYVTFSSASVKAEIMMRRNFILAEINRELGTRSVRAIVLK